jgi:hypothetical protein
MKKTSIISRIVLLAAALAAVAVPFNLKATPYASCLTNNGGNIQFYLNESNATIVVTYEDGTTNANFNGITSGTNVPAGQLSFLLGAHSSYAITVTKIGSGSPSLIKTLALPGATVNPRGVDVNKNTASPYFGRVYEVSGGGSPPGVMLMNPDLSYVYSNTNARNGGITTFGSAGTGTGQSPYRLWVAPDDSVIVGDATTGGSAVYQIDPNFTTNSFNKLILGPVGDTAGLAAGSHGTVESRPLLLGSTNGGNAVLLQIDGQISPYNSLLIYNVGSGPWPWNNPPSVVGPQVGVGVDSITLGGNEYPGLTRGPNGYFYCSTYRANLSNPLIQVYDATGTNILWNSWQPDGTPYNVTGVGNGTPSGDYFLLTIQGIGEGVADSAVSADGKYLVAMNLHNGIIICALTNGIPNPASIFTVNNISTTSSSRGVAWDAALNFYVSSSGIGVVQEWSLGVSAKAITMGNATGQTNFSLTLPSTTVSVTATTPQASQNGPTPGVFTITRSSVVSSDTNAPLTVFFTLGGTATNGTPYLTTNTTSGVNNGINTTNITITSNVPTNGVYTFSGEVITNFTAYSTNTFYTTNGVIITTNMTITARTTYTATLSVVFAPGQDSTNITIIPVNDGLSRPTTPVILTLVGSGSYALVPLFSDTVYIQNTGPQFLFISSVPAPTMYKGLTNDFVSFVVTRWGDTNAATYTGVSSYVTSGAPGAFTGPSDFMTFNPGDLTVTNKTISPVINTTNYVGNKTFTLTVTFTTFPQQGTNTATFTIIDNANLPATVLYANPLTNPNDATNWAVTAANDDMFNEGGAVDNTIEFGYDLTANNPESVNNGLIPLPPSGATNALRVTVNKNMGRAAGVNLYPTNVTFSGDYAVRFAMNIAEGNNANFTTEGPLFGINHTGMDTNWWTGSGIFSGWDPSNTSSNWASDGVWYWVAADGGAGAGDYLEKTGVGGTNNNNTGWQNLASALRATFANNFKDPVPYSTLNGTTPAAGLPANSSPFNGAQIGGYTNAWADVEIKTVKNKVTLSINKTTIFIYTNTTIWTNGTIMLGYNDPFGSPTANSIGGSDAAVYFSDVKVVRLSAPAFTLQPTNIVVGKGSNATFAVALSFDSSSANTNGQWLFNGAAIAGATNYVYSFTVATNSYGTYSFSLNDSNYIVVSSNALLTPPLPNIVSVLPTTRAAALNGSASFTVTANTFSGITNYQWLSNSVPIASATASTLTISPVRAGNFGSIYTVRLNDGTTSITSAPPVTITVAVSQLITSPALLSGAKFRLSVNTESGPSYVVETKTNLLQTSWLPLSTNAGTGGIINVTNNITSGVQGYYRVRLQ